MENEQIILSNLEPRRGAIHAGFKQYSALLVTIADLAREAGSPIQAFEPSRPSKFPGLSPEIQSGIIATLSTCHDLCAGAVRNGLTLRQNDLSLAWWAIRSFNLRPLSDVFSHLKENDIIEIYDKDHVQIFRSFDFFKFVSYSLDEICTHSWWELYERDEKVTEKMIEVANQAVENKNPRTLLAPFPTHFTTEKFSDQRRVTHIESRLVSPLLNGQGEPSGYINAFSIVSVSSLNSPST